MTRHADRIEYLAGECDVARRVFPGSPGRSEGIQRAGLALTKALEDAGMGFETTSDAVEILRQRDDN